MSDRLGALRPRKTAGVERPNDNLSQNAHAARTLREYTCGLMALLFKDTSPAAERVLLEALRRKTPAERFRLALEASEALRQMVWASVRRDYPEADEQQQFRQFAHRWLGAELARKVYGPDDLDARGGG